MQQKRNNDYKQFRILIRGFYKINLSLFFICAFFLFYNINYSISQPVEKNIDSLYDEFNRNINPIHKFEVLKKICSYWRFNDYDSALVYCGLTIEMAEKLGKIEDCLEHHIVIGHMHHTAGHFSDAIEKFAFALNEFIELKDTVKIALSYNHLAMSYHQFGNLDKALEYYKEAVRLAKIVGDPRPIANYANNLATVYRRLNDYDNALYYHQLSHDLYRQADDLPGVGNVLNNMAIIFYNKGDYKNAIQLFKNAAEIREKTGNNQELGNVLFNIGFVYNAIGEVKKANEYFLKSLQLGIMLSSLPLQRTNYEMLSKNYEKIGNHKSALEYYNLFISITDSINAVRQTNRLLEIKTEQEKRIEEMHINVLLKKSELDLLTQRKSLFVFYSTLFIFIALVSFLVIILFLIRKKAKMNKMLSDQNDAILSHRDELYNRKETLELLNNELKEKDSEVSLQNELLNEKAKELNQIVLDLEHRKDEVESSLRYAAMLQNALKSSYTISSGIIHDFFVYPSQSKSLSDSSFWICESGGNIFVAVFDAPQKSISGAFYCVMVNTMLDRVVNEQMIHDPHRILDEVFNNMENTLSKSSLTDCFTTNECGFLMARINYQSMTVDFCSLNLPFILTDAKGIVKMISPYDGISSNPEFRDDYKIKIFPNEKLWIMNQATLRKYEEVANGGFTNEWEAFLSCKKSKINESIMGIVNMYENDTEMKNKLLILGFQIT
ncbi:MAG: tetratricopeptide repeat protein [Bacteroidetes bacterium]|nr:tetratricopeptide repeat protein [Bacteroidota bacterium]